MELGADVRSWIGRSWESSDVIDRRLIDEFRSTLLPHLASQEEVPPGIFWCLSPDLATADQLGGDGHPKLGLFLPRIPLPRRMWAGGEVTFLADFVPEAEVTRRSVIEDIAMKIGKSGALCFLTMRLEYKSGGLVLLRERRDIVYRQASVLAGRDGDNALPAYSPPPGSWLVVATPTLLFRYSAMTFNGHRIHYDYPYATGVEGYGGLVVHGPLQATLLMNRAAELLGRMPKQFTYRGLAPLICGKPFHVVAEDQGSGLSLKVFSASGVQTMEAAAA